MATKKTIQAAWLAGSIALILTACGGGSAAGGSGSGSGGGSSFSTTVIDGAIQYALVCLDKNSNGVCDSSEPQGRTNAAGKVTFSIDTADAGKYPVLAVVGTDAVDADTGAVPTAYTMTAPADQPGVVSPLTTLVQQTVVSTGASTGEAVATIQSVIGLSGSVFQDYTQVAAPTNGTTNPSALARALVIATQQQSIAVASVLGASAADGSTITKAKLDTAIQKKILDLLPGLVVAMNDSSVTGASTFVAKEAALLTQMHNVILASGLTPAGMPTVIAINNQTSTPSIGPAATLRLASFIFIDTANYWVHAMTGTMAQYTPDANNSTRYVERNLFAIFGALTSWGAGSEPKRQSDLSWNGSAWTACPMNSENISSAPDALGNTTYNYCNSRAVGRSHRAAFNIAGQSMLSIYNQMRDARYANVSISNAATALGAATFPANSMLYYQAETATAAAYAYYPGSGSPVGLSNVMTQYSQSLNTGTPSACTSPEYSSPGTNSTSLESLIQANPGIPCVFSQASFTYGGVIYKSDVPNEAWSNSSVSIGRQGLAPLNSGTASGYYSGNTRFRVAFKGAGPHPTTYYACKERFDNGAVRNCKVIGTGSYTITTLGDARVLSFSNMPAQMAPLSYTQIFVERGGKIYQGYQPKLSNSNSARFNLAAANALFTQLGIPTVDVNAPLDTSAGSFEGIWDLSLAGTGSGSTLTLNVDGSYSCANGGATPVAFACNLSITSPATGGFIVAYATGSLQGTFNAQSGTVSGTYTDSALTPSSGSFSGQRR